jgi:hypothetical protein
LIIWLASYPRSGNTLLRTVLRQTMGYGSFEDEINPELEIRIALTDAVVRRVGHLELPDSWDSFYREASASAETFFVKTHLPPRDEQPTIYVVRDGRLALISYVKYHGRFHAEHGKSLLELVMGHDYYGGWSEHYCSWITRKGGKTLVVRYEDLVNASDALRGRIAEFVGRALPPESWKNPFEQLREESPGVFGAGRLEWGGDSSWSPFIDGVFFQNHGALMEELGYASCADVTKARNQVTSSELDLVRLVRSLIKEKRELEQVCQERSVVIGQLDRACNERLALIEKLTAG